jgi:aryl-alcohol dehydrogenase-like predicted oxidoreductase
MLAQPLGVVSGDAKSNLYATWLREKPDSKFESHWNNSRNIKPRSLIGAFLREPNVASAIIGATRVEQIEENVAASGAGVDPALFVDAERLIGRAAKPAR